MTYIGTIELDEESDWLTQPDWKLELVEDYPELHATPVAPAPRRDDEVATWIKEKRDRYTQEEPNDFWQALDDLLDDCRLHADTGTPLNQPTPHPNPDY